MVLTGAERFDPRVNRRTRVLRRRAPRSCATAIECEPRGVRWEQSQHRSPALRRPTHKPRPFAGGCLTTLGNILELHDGQPKVKFSDCH